MSPKVAVRPSDPVLEEAARAGGATLVEPDEADAIIWAIPRDPEGLKQILASSPATWVQLPFAGIERFFEADAIDPGRTWTCAKGIYGSTTAEGALALTLAAARQIHTHARATSWEREYVTGDSHRRLVGTRRRAGRAVGCGRTTRPTRRTSSKAARGRRSPAMLRR